MSTVDAGVCRHRAGKFPGAFPSARTSVRGNLVWVFTSNNTGRLSDRVSSVRFAHMVGVFLLELELTMARGKGKGSAGSSSVLPVFVNVSLTQGDREALREYTPDAVGLVDWLESMARSGYRVGLNWNGERESYICSVTARDTGTANDGKCVTSFAGSVLHAVFVAWFKHTHVLGDVWEVPSPVDESGWG